MKKNLINALCCLSFLVFNSCAGSSSSYQEACTNGDFEEAHKLLGEIHETFVSTGIDSDDYLTKAREYFSALEYIYKAEIQHIVTNLDDEACKDKITFLLTEIPIDGQKPDESFETHEVNFVEGSWGEEAHVRPYKVYGYYVTSHNNLLNHALTLAINRKHKKLAENILLQYIDDLEFRLWDYDYHADYSRSSYNAAKEKYDQAVSMQAFE